MGKTLSVTKKMCRANEYQIKYDALARVLVLETLVTV